MVSLWDKGFLIIHGEASSDCIGNDYIQSVVTEEFSLSSRRQTRLSEGA
jgi:hypothetical protein